MAVVTEHIVKTGEVGVPVMPEKLVRTYGPLSSI
jgi:hypothetical protein